MFMSFAAARDALEGVAREFDASTSNNDAARRSIDELGAIRRLTGEMLAKAAKRVAEIATNRERSGAAFVAPDRSAYER
jgi:hypothetical protein